MTEHVAENATMQLSPDVPPLRRVAFKAGKTDTVASIARRYRVGISQVAEWNAMAATARFKPGATIVVYQSTTRSAPTRIATAATKAKPAVRVAARSGSKTVQAAAPQRSTKLAANSNRKTLQLAAR